MTRREALEKLPALKVELENMQAGRPYNAHTPEMYEYRDEVKKLLRDADIDRCSVMPSSQKSVSDYSCCPIQQTMCTLNRPSSVTTAILSLQSRECG